MAKQGKTTAHLVHVKSGVLKLTKHAARDIITEWSDADYPLERAVSALRELGEQHGISDAARTALEVLVRTGREPDQHTLFD